MKFKEIKNIQKEERENKIKELKMELIKAKSTSSKTPNSKAKDIKKIIARILTLNSQDKLEIENKK